MVNVMVKMVNIIGDDDRNRIRMSKELVKMVIVKVNAKVDASNECDASGKSDNEWGEGESESCDLSDNDGS